MENLNKGTRFINIDETTLDCTNFTDKKWCEQGTSNSLPNKGIKPRISMIVGLASDGEIYVSLTQVNTNTDMIMLFISRLALILGQEHKDWRKNTILLLDGASYHKSADSRKLFDNMSIKIMLSAPYSFAGAAIEYFFGYFKKGNLNKGNYPLGKR